MAPSLAHLSANIARQRLVVVFADYMCTTLSTRMLAWRNDSEGTWLAVQTIIDWLIVAWSIGWLVD